MKARWLVLLGLLAFLVSAILNAPADRLYAMVAARQAAPALQLHGVQGTLSAGGVAGISLHRRPMLGALEWQLQPAWLLLLRLSVDLEMRGDPQVQATLSRGLFGRLRVSGADASGTVRGLLAAVGAPPLPMEGQVRLTLPSAQFVGGLPVQADGLAEIQGLTWTLSREPMLLGDFNANLATDDKGVLAQLGSASGPVELGGEVRLMPDRSWEAHLQVKPRPGAPPQVVTLVRSLGNPDSAGWYHLRRRGNL